MKKKSSNKRRAPKLGQHFLTGTWAARALTRAANISEGTTVVEIGPGTGALTKELLATGGHVIAIEKDSALVEKLRETFAAELSSGQLRLLKQDVRNFDPARCALRAGNYVLAANIPYYITGEIIRMFLSSDTHPRNMLLLLQKEVAQRITAQKESILSISVKAYGNPKIIAKVARGNFSPPPAVDSAIIRIENISKSFFDNIDEQDFFRIVRAGFASKRKLLASNLTKLGTQRSEVIACFQHCSIPENVRAEDLALAQWKCLAHELAEVIARDSE